MQIAREWWVLWGGGGSLDVSYMTVISCFGLTALSTLRLLDF